MPRVARDQEGAEGVCVSVSVNSEDEAIEFDTNDKKSKPKNSKKNFAQTRFR